MKKYVSTVRTIFFIDFTITSFAHFSFFSTLTENSLFQVTQFLASEATEAGSIFDDLQNTLSTQHGEMAVFARELRHVCTLIILYILRFYSHLCVFRFPILHFSLFLLIFFYLFLHVLFRVLYMKEIQS